jgi:hypothetical protein
MSDMAYAAITNPIFVGKLQAWLESQSEILVLILYSHAAGSRSFEFFDLFDALVKRLLELPPLTCVVAFKQPQLPLRGVVDDDFIAACLKAIPDGEEYLITETVRRIDGRASWYRNAAGTTHAELVEDLNESRQRPVAVGVYPPFVEDTDDVISAVVPDENGNTRGGAY